MFVCFPDDVGEAEGIRQDVRGTDEGYGQEPRRAPQDGGETEDSRGTGKAPQNTGVRGPPQGWPDCNRKS